MTIEHIFLSLHCNNIWLLGEITNAFLPETNIYCTQCYKTLITSFRNYSPIMYGMFLISFDFLHETSVFVRLIKKKVTH